MALTGATVVCGNGREDHEVQCAFASDLMSDVLTLDCNGVLLVTGLCNMQTIRTAEMADVSCILFVMLSSQGVTEDKIPTLAKDAFAAGSTANNPRVPTVEEIETIYKSIF